MEINLGKRLNVVLAAMPQYECSRRGAHGKGDLFTKRVCLCDTAVILCLYRTRIVLHRVDRSMTRVNR